jgi:pentatricopeptide repeat domain-containing protein 1
MQVLEVIGDMENCGCERTVITYSSLISACEKAGRWELALQMFARMYQEGCRPNTITFNSLITACAQGTLISIEVNAKAYEKWMPKILSS